MNDAQQQKNAALIRSRFNDYMLSEKVALARLGLAPKKLAFETSRELLDIEANALEQKQKQKATASEFKDYINEYFHDALFEYLDERTENVDYLLTEILTIDPVIPKLFDACAAKASSASTFEKLITELPFLTRDVLNLVNNPPFREPNSKKAHVDNVGLAVRYVGVDNMKFALLTYIAKNWLPHSTEPYTDFKTRYWQYALATANCARELSKHYKVSEHVAFMFGMLQGIGMSLTLRMYLRAFDTVRVQQMKKVVKAGRKDIEKVLDSLTIDDNFVSDALNKYALKVTQVIFDNVELKYAVVAPAAQELANDTPFAEAMPLTQLTQQAKAFVQYKMLQKSRLIELDEAKLFLTNASINNKVIALLNQVNLKKLNLTPTD